MLRWPPSSSFFPVPRLSLATGVYVMPPVQRILPQYRLAPKSAGDEPANFQAGGATFDRPLRDLPHSERGKSDFQRRASTDSSHRARWIPGHPDAFLSGGSMSGLDFMKSPWLYVEIEQRSLKVLNGE